MSGSSQVSQLSRVLRTSPARVVILLSQSHLMYRTRREPKRTGGFRVIQSPHKELKRAQKNLLQWLYEKTRWHSAATAGFKGASILLHARPHVGQPCVLTTDIRGFFDAVNYGQVRSALQRNGIPLALAQAITKLTTRKKALPQGAPTSPLLGNLVLFGLDRRISRFCQRHNLRYTRYIDDIAISGDLDPQETLQSLKHMIENAGFHVAEDKTLVQSASSEQVVTGVAVNHGLSIPAKRQEELRRLFRSSRECGPGDAKGVNPAEDRRSLAGHLSFVRMIDRQLYDELRMNFAKINWSAKGTYRD